MKKGRVVGGENKVVIIAKVERVRAVRAQRDAFGSGVMRASLIGMRINFSTGKGEGALVWRFTAYRLLSATLP